MSDVAAPPRNDWLRASWAGLLSLILPGLGQVYAGAWRLGIILYIAAFALSLSWIALTWVVLPTPGAVVASGCAILLFHLVVAIDAARRVRLRSIAPSNPWYRSTWLAAVVIIAISVGLELSNGFPYSPGWRSFHVASSSNMPTLSTTDYVLVDTYHPGSAPGYGDVVVFRHPRDPKVDYIKRAVGLPGDRVQLRDGILYLNGKPVPREPEAGAADDPAFKQYRETLPNGRAYSVLETSESAAQSTEEFNVPPGFFFVLGDNRGNSLDSRYKDLGYIPIANVIGIVRTIYWTTAPTRLLSRVQ
ncbi:MAG TPA: signal peptidase I [Reyranella sp.]|jgi:signal peptidase I|nr:signal peptidase I [Reyranella sp.]